MTPRIAATISADGANTVPSVLGSFDVGNLDTDFQLMGNVFVTSYGSGQFWVTVTFTDEAGNSVTLTLATVGAAGTHNDVILRGIRAKANTTVTFAIADGFFGSAMTLNARLYALQMSNL